MGSELLNEEAAITHLLFCL